MPRAPETLVAKVCGRGDPPNGPERSTLLADARRSGEKGNSPDFLLLLHVKLSSLFYSRGSPIFPRHLYIQHFLFLHVQFGLDLVNTLPFSCSRWLVHPWSSPRERVTTSPTALIRMRPRLQWPLLPRPRLRPSTLQCNRILPLRNHPSRFPDHPRFYDRNGHRSLPVLTPELATPSV